MKKIYFLMTLFAICCYVLISDFNTSSVNTSVKCEVSFHFDGLQAIAFGDSKRVSDGILDVHHHTPLIEIKEIKAGKETLIRTIKADELKGKVLNIDVPNTQLQPTRYYSPDMSKDTQDFRWCLDIENDLFQKQLYLREDKLFCKIHFMEGEFFASQLTDGKYQFISGSKILSFNRRIGEPGAKLQLVKGESLVITGFDEPISLPYLSNASYKIDITNLPSRDMMNMDHFAFYYDAVKEDVTKFMPIVSKKAAFVPRPLLCGATVFGKSRIQ
jgi:hypothetical protein